MSEVWWSAKLSLLCLVEDSDPAEPCLKDESVVVFRARDEGAAFAKALELGRAREIEYVNGDGVGVRWRLDRVLAVTRVGDEIDGVEVHSEFSWHHDGNPRYDAQFTPELEEPHWSN